MNKRMRPCMGLLAALSAVACSTVAAQGFPERPVMILQSSTAGSGPDVFLRTGVNLMAEGLKQPVTVDARPGAQGTVAAMAVKGAQSDGYTLLFNHSGNMIMDPVLGPVPFDTSKDFKPISVAYYTLAIITVPGSSNVRTVADLVAAGRARPEGIFYGSASTSTDLLVALVAQAVGAKFVPVPYKGVPQVMTDVAAGRVDFGVGTPQPTIKSLVDAGKMRIIGMVWPNRIDQLPYPTLVESGIPVQRSLTWFGLFAPANTPDAVVRTLHREFTRAFGSPAVREAALGQGAAVTLSDTPEDFARLIESDKVTVAKVIRDLNLKSAK